MIPNKDTEIFQEFYCNDCNGYIRLWLPSVLKKKSIVVRCPNCDREHPRTIENGQVIDNYNSGGKSAEEICPTMAAYSKKPISTIGKHARDGNQIKNKSDLVILEKHDDLMAKELLKESKGRNWAKRLVELGTKS